MRVLGTFIVIATVLLCSTKSEKIILEGCTKHCDCYEYEKYSHNVKVSCFKRGLSQVSKLEILPKVMLVFDIIQH